MVETMNTKPVLVDLFCGCGGFGLGAELAGFHTIAAIDIDPTLQSAYKNNFPHTKVLNKDLSLLDENGFRHILGRQKIDLAKDIREWGLVMLMIREENCWKIFSGTSIY